jgi:hypothetical protein
MEGLRCLKMGDVLRMHVFAAAGSENVIGALPVKHFDLVEIENESEIGVSPRGHGDYDCDCDYGSDAGLDYDRDPGPGPDHGHDRGLRVVVVRRQIFACFGRNCFSVHEWEIEKRKRKQKQEERRRVNYRFLYYQVPSRRVRYIRSGDCICNAANIIKLNKFSCRTPLESSDSFNFSIS